jgi:hypothetical protein
MFSGLHDAALIPCGTRYASHAIGLFSISQPREVQRTGFFGWTMAADFAICAAPARGRGETGRRAGLKKWFVYQSTGKHDELKTACFQRFMKEGKEADDILFSL